MWESSKVPRVLMTLVVRPRESWLQVMRTSLPFALILRVLSRPSASYVKVMMSVVPERGPTIVAG